MKIENIENYPLNLAMFLKGDSEIEINLNELEKLVESLLEKESKVIRFRFRDKLTLEEVGRKLNVTRERVRQIEAKALRKLRHNELKTLHIKDIKTSMLQEQIDELDLSLRAYNCLKRANKHTIGDVAEMKTSDFYKCINLVKKATNEIIDKMAEIGIKIEL